MKHCVASALKDRNLELEDAALVRTCEELAETFSFGADELAMEIERLLFSRPNNASIVTEGLLDNLSSQLAREKAKRPRLETLRFNQSSWDDAAAQVLTDSTNLLRTEHSPARLAGTLTNPQDGKETAVANAGVEAFEVQTIIERLEGSGPDPQQCGSSAELCTVERISRGLPPEQRYMADRLADKAAFLDNRIMDFARAFEEAEGSVCSTPVHQAMQEPALYVGRVVCESEGRMMANNVMLEGSVLYSQGHRVQLDLSRLPSYRIFPGQVVGMEAINPTGQSLVPSRVVSCLPASKRCRVSAGSSGRSIVVAAGPFSYTSDLAYMPLHLLLQWCSVNKPSVLVLIGPFVDVDHPLVAGGLLCETFDDIFDHKVMKPIIEFAEGSGSCTQILLIPATRDIHHDFVLPQPPFSQAAPHNVLHLPNPATFSIDEDAVGCLSTDVLMHLSGQELAKVAAGSGTVDRMTALCSHLLGQRSFYPMHPPALGAMMDTALAAELTMQETPAILFLPSGLAPFAKFTPLHMGKENTDQILCLNPGRLAKGSALGTFMTMQVGPCCRKAGPIEGEGCPGSSIATDLDKRVTVSIVRM